MTDSGMSLDDIIKKSKPSKPSVMRGRGGFFFKVHSSSCSQLPEPTDDIDSPDIDCIFPCSRVRRGTGRGVKANSTPRPRPSQIVTDARLKIIQKNREKLTDARDKLAEIAKQSDARLKLDKLRATHLKKGEPPLSGISRKTGRNGRISLSTNKIPPLISHVPSQNYLPPPTRNIGYKPPPPEPHYFVDDASMDYNDDAYLMDAPPLRRTVNIEYAPAPPPPPPVFAMKPASPYTWVKQPSSNSLRVSLPRKPEPERPREFKVVARSQMSKYDVPSYRDDWAFSSKFRTILPEGPVEPRYMEPRSQREVGIKSRLDAMPLKPRTLGMMSRPKTTTSASGSSSGQSTGYRIVVSNLQANVTQEDIKELFEDVGELLVSRLVRPGTAEVIYKTLKDATKAVETYHNRQLDGHPMKCLLVNPRPKNNPVGSSGRILEPRRGGSSSMQPSLGTVHRALFDDIVVKLRPN